MIIRDRKELIDFLQETLIRSPLRALLNKNELLGGFDPMVGPKPGWIVRVTSETGKEWLIGVTPEPGRRFKIYYLDKILWENWAGYPFYSELHRGDNTAEYVKLCDEAKLRLEKELRHES